MTNSLDEDAAIDPPLAKLLSQVPDEPPPAGWEDKVRATFAPPRRKPYRYLAYAATGGFALAAIVVGTLFVMRGPEARNIEVARVGPDGKTLMGETFTIQDRIAVKIHDKASEVRVYHDGALVITCNRDCLTPQLSAGVTTIVGYYGDAPRAVDFATDLKSAREAHVSTYILPDIIVR